MRKSRNLLWQLADAVQWLALVVVIVAIVWGASVVLFSLPALPHV